MCRSKQPRAMYTSKQPCFFHKRLQRACHRQHDSLSCSLCLIHTHAHRTVTSCHAFRLGGGGGSEANIALCAEASLSSCSVTLTALIQLSFLLKTHIRVTDVKDGQQYNQVLLLQLPLTGRSPHAEVFPLS